MDHCATHLFAGSGDAFVAALILLGVCLIVLAWRAL